MYDDFELNDYDANVDAEEAYHDGVEQDCVTGCDQAEYYDGEYGEEDSFIDNYYESRFERDYDF